MAAWGGEERDDEFQYLWQDLGNGVGDWNFDGLFEDAYDELGWDADLPATASRSQQPNAPPPHHSPPSSSSVTNTPHNSASWQRGTPPSHEAPRPSPGPHSSTSTIPPGRPLSPPLLGNNATSRSHNTTLHQTSRPTAQTSAANLSSLLQERSQQLHHNRQASSFGYNPAAFAHSPFDPPASPSSASSFNGIDIDDLVESDNDNLYAASMPATSRNRRANEESVVDLTDESASVNGQAHSRGQMAGRKRSAANDGGVRASASKRRRTAQPTTAQEEEGDIESYDLTNDDNPSTEELLRRKQQESLIATQQQSSGDDPSQPLRIGRRQCIICLEPFTNLTITPCGHVYCHECLTQALKAGEKNSDRGVGSCPVCRKTVSRKRANNIIPVSFMKRSAWKGKQKRSLEQFR